MWCCGEGSSELHARSRVCAENVLSLSLPDTVALATIRSFGGVCAARASCKGLGLPVRHFLPVCVLCKINSGRTMSRLSVAENARRAPHAAWKNGPTTAGDPGGQDVRLGTLSQTKSCWRVCASVGQGMACVVLARSGIVLSRLT